MGRDVTVGRRGPSFGFRAALSSLLLASEAAALTSGVVTPEATGYQVVDEGPAVDRATGGFNWRLPVLTVPGRGGLDYTVTLGYQAGIRTHQEASWVGLGWDLAPGAIFRVTGHVPDDYQGQSVSMGFAGSGSALDASAFGIGLNFTRNGNARNFGFSLDAGALGASYSNDNGKQNLGVSAQASWPFVRLFPKTFSLAFSWYRAQGSRTWDVWGFLHLEDPASLGCPGGSCDARWFRRELQAHRHAYVDNSPAEPPMDRYVVEGPGPRGPLVASRSLHYAYWKDNDHAIGGVGKFYFADRGMMPTTVQHVFAPGGAIDRFVITDPDGTRYVYGAPARVQSQGHLGHNALSFAAASHWSRFELNAPYAYAWYLTAILSPDYVSTAGVPPTDLAWAGPVAADKGNWVKFTYATHTSDYRFSEPYEGVMEAPQITVLDGGNDYVTRSWGAKEILYLAEVSTPTHAATFVTSDRLDARESSATWAAPGTAAGGSEHMRRLDRIELRTRSGVLVRSVDLGYDYSLRPSTINSNVPGGGSSTLRSVTFKGSAAGTEKTYAFDYSTFNPAWGQYKWDRWGYYKAAGDWKEHSVTDGHEATAWSLEKIAYPAGGSLTIALEGNAFAKYWAQATIGNAPQWGGGVRVAALSIDDGAATRKTRFLYHTDDMTPVTQTALVDCSGAVGNVPPSYERDAGLHYGSPFASDDVYYSKVIEIRDARNDGSEPFGRTVYTFTTPADYSDLGPVDYNNGVPDDPYQGDCAACQPKGYGYFNQAYLHHQDPGGCVNTNAQGECWGPWANFYSKSWAWRKADGIRKYHSTGYLLYEERNEYSDPFDDGLGGTVPLPEVVYFRADMAGAKRHFSRFFLTGWLRLDRRTITQDGVTTTVDYDFDGARRLVSTTTRGDTSPFPLRQDVTRYVIQGLQRVDDVWTWVCEGGIGNGQPCVDVTNAGRWSLVAARYVARDGVPFSQSSNHGARYTYRKEVDGRLYLDSTYETAFHDDGTVWTEDLRERVMSRDDFGNVIEIADGSGRFWTRGYLPGTSYLEGESDPLAHYTGIEYDSRYRVTTIRDDDNGTQTSYGWDEHGRLASVTPAATTATTYDYTHMYDGPGVGFIKTLAPIDNDLIRDSRSYADGLGRVVRTTDNGATVAETTYNGLGLVEHACDGAGRCAETRYEASPLERVERVYPNAVNAAIYSQTTYESGVTQAGRSVRAIQVQDPRGNASRTLVDGLGRAVEVHSDSDDGFTYGSARLASYLSDGNSNGSWVVDPLTGDKASFNFFDSRGRRIAAWKPEYPKACGMSQCFYQTDTWGYDAAGRVATFADVATDAAGRHFHTTYDEIGRVTSRRLHDSAHAPTVDTGGHDVDVKRFHDGDYTGAVTAPGAYDAGRLTREDSADQTVYYFYDAAGRVTRREVFVRPGSLRFFVDYTYTTGGLVKSRSIQEHGKPADPATTVCYVYDAGGRIDRVFRGMTTCTASSPATSQVARFTYYDDNRIASVVRGSGVMTTSYSYDDFARLSSMQTASTRYPTNPSWYARSYDYDPNGNMKNFYATADRSGASIGELEYDRTNQITHAKVRDGAGNLGTQGFSYDRSGNRLSVTQGTAAKVYPLLWRPWQNVTLDANSSYDLTFWHRKVYNPDNRPTRVHLHDSIPGTTVVADASGKWTKHIYRFSTGSVTSAGVVFILQGESPPFDEFNLVDDVSLVKVGTTTNVLLNPGFEQGTSAWGLAPELLVAREPVNYAYEAGTNKVTGTSGAGSSAKVYAGRWQPGQQVTLEANTDYQITYWHRKGGNPSNRSTRAHVESANPLRYLVDCSAVADTTYRWTKVTCTFNTGNANVTTPPGLSLILEGENPPLDEYNLVDDVKLVKVGTAINLVTNSGFEQGMTGWTMTPDLLVPSGARAYAYNVRGDLVSGLDELGAGRTLSYDALGRVRDVDTGTLHESYRYDAAGLRIERESTTQTSGEHAFYLYDGGQPIWEYRTTWQQTACKPGQPITDEGYCYTNSAVKQFHFYANGMRLFTISDSNGYRSYLHVLGDHLGNTSVLTDVNGTELGRSEYFPFGEKLRATGTVGDRRYNDKELDDTGLYYYGARYYDAALGRFLQRDTVESAHPYAYVDNNPIVLKDPTGHEPVRADSVAAPPDSVWAFDLQGGQFQKVPASEAQDMGINYADLLVPGAGTALAKGPSMLGRLGKLVRGAFGGASAELAKIKQVLSSYRDTFPRHMGWVGDASRFFRGPNCGSAGELNRWLQGDGIRGFKVFASEGHEFLRKGKDIVDQTYTQFLKSPDSAPEVFVGSMDDLKKFFKGAETVDGFDFNAVYKSAVER